MSTNVPNTMANANIIMLRSLVKNPSVLSVAEAAVDDVNDSDCVVEGVVVVVVVVVVVGADTNTLTVALFDILGTPSSAAVTIRAYGATEISPVMSPTSNILPSVSISNFVDPVIEYLTRLLGEVLSASVAGTDPMIPVG